MVAQASGLLLANSLHWVICRLLDMLWMKHNQLCINFAFFIIVFWRWSAWSQDSLLHLSECFRVFSLAGLVASYSNGTNISLHFKPDGACPSPRDGMPSFHFWFGEGFGIQCQPSLKGLFLCLVLNSTTGSGNTYFVFISVTIMFKTLYCRFHYIKAFTLARQVYKLFGGSWTSLFSAI